MAELQSPVDLLNPGESWDNGSEGGERKTQILICTSLIRWNGIQYKQKLTLFFFLCVPLQSHWNAQPGQGWLVMSFSYICLSAALSEVPAWASASPRDVFEIIVLLLISVS